VPRVEFDVPDPLATGVFSAGAFDSVVVAVLTYRRPVDLFELLGVLVDQAAQAHADVLVVDNDPDGGAQAVVDRFVEGADARVSLTYVQEPRPGIAAARNRALAEASHRDLLVFLDDDERPVDRWLELMLGAFVRHGCAAVVGPVVSTFAHPLSRWVSAGRFFDRRRLATGTEVKVAATNNLLLDLRQIRRLGLTFDERFGLSGGSDTLFTRELHQRGGVLIWCDEALVVDVVPAARLSARWVLLRAFRSGNGWTRTSLALAHSRRRRNLVRLRLTGAGGFRLVAGAARAALGLAARNVGHQARGCRTMARGAGTRRVGDRARSARADDVARRLARTRSARTRRHRRRARRPVLPLGLGPLGLGPLG